MIPVQVGFEMRHMHSVAWEDYLEVDTMGRLRGESSHVLEARDNFLGKVRTWSHLAVFLQCGFHPLDLPPRRG